MAIAGRKETEKFALVLTIFKPTVPFEPVFQPARFESWYRSGTEDAPLSDLGGIPNSKL